MADDDFWLKNQENGIMITAIAANIDMGTHIDDMGTHIVIWVTHIDIGARYGLHPSYLLQDYKMKIKTKTK